jgi:transcriptional antiterminator RfaH
LVDFLRQHRANVISEVIVVIAGTTSDFVWASHLLQKITRTVNIIAILFGEVFTLQPVPEANSASHTSSGWGVVKSRAGQEWRAKENLERQGFCVFLPHRAIRVRQSRKVVDRRQPIFPGYLFVNLADTGPGKISSTLGVRYLLTHSCGSPLIVAIQVMEELISQCDNLGLYSPEMNLRVGDRVNILSGPLVHSVAYVETLPADGRISAFIEMMGQKVRAIVPLTDIEKI